jgi:manganese/zinc/iron transport system permease protein
MNESGHLPPWLEFFTFSNVNVTFVFVGCILLGMSTGVLGCFAFLRKRSLLGDALAHAALPGVCAAFLLTGTKNPLIILAGAMVSCWLGALSIELIVRYTRCKEDSALGMVLSVFFGVGIVLLTYIQQTGAAAQAGLDKFLFGQAAALVDQDVWTLAILSGLILFIVALAYKEFKVFSFDPGFATGIGLPVRAIEIVLATLIVVAVGIGLQAVGVVLMAAMLVTPAAGARYWTDRLGFMLVLAGVFGALSGGLGAYISYLSPKMPTGPWMVVAATILFAISFFGAPKRGMLPRFVRHLRFRRRTAEENVLRTMYLLGEPLGQWGDNYSATELMQYRSMRATALSHTLHRLIDKDLVREPAEGRYALTEDGVRRAARVTRLHRLWELYLTRKLEIAPDHVHDDAEEIEHILTPELEERLAALLEHPEEDPHASRIPGQLAHGEG